MITRRDLASGYQGVQSIHAAIQFGIEHPETYKIWFEKSNYLGWLSVADEAALCRLIETAKDCGIEFSIFREPDIGNEITAIALQPGCESKRLCRNLPLALKEDKK